MYNLLQCNPTHGNTKPYTPKISAPSTSCNIQLLSGKLFPKLNGKSKTTGGFSNFRPNEWKNSILLSCSLWTCAQSGLLDCSPGPTMGKSGQVSRCTLDQVSILSRDMPPSVLLISQGLKGQCHEIFNHLFFVNKHLPGLLVVIYNIFYFFRKFLKLFVI